MPKLCKIVSSERTAIHRSEMSFLTGSDSMKGQDSQLVGEGCATYSTLLEGLSCLGAAPIETDSNVKKVV